MDFSYLFTSFEGRISRQPYWIGVIILIAASLVALMVKRFQDRNRAGWFAALLLVPIILQGITNIIGITGDPLNQGMLDYLFAAWIFVVGIWFFIELGCLRGTVGPNQYGPDPLGEKA